MSMRLFDESLVRDDEIDTLGHLNVRHYMARVLRSGERLTGELGLGAKARAALDAILARVDTYSSYKREQFTGAALEVWGGVLAATTEGVRTYFEVRNPAKGEIAASFIIEFALLDRATRGRLSLPAEALTAAALAHIDLPAHGAPRTIAQAKPNLLVTMGQIAARVGERPPGDGMMGGIMERLVETEDCDAEGFLKEGEDMMFGARIRAQFMQGKTFGPPTFVSDEGHRFGWATLEARLVQLQVPRAGDLLRAFGADIGIGRKTRHTRRWIFNTATGALAGVDDIVGIALDLDARRSIEIPASVLESLQGGFVPEFA